MLVSLEGRVQKTISVLGKRTIAALDFGSDKHSFLFSDRVLEQKNLLDKSSYYYSIDLDFFANISSLSITNQLMAFIADGHFYVYQLARS